MQSRPTPASFAIAAAARRSYAYDWRGNVTQRKHTVDGVIYTRSEAYHPTDRTARITYPDGDAVGTAGAPWVHNDDGAVVSIPGVIDTTEFNAWAPSAGAPTRTGPSLPRSTT